MRAKTIHIIIHFSQLQIRKNPAGGTKRDATWWRRSKGEKEKETEIDRNREGEKERERIAREAHRGAYF